MACYTTIITTEAQKFLPPEFERCNMSEVDTIKNVTIVGIGTQGSMIAFRNALYGKNVTGYSRTQPSIDTCKNKIEKWLAHFIEEGKLTKDEADAVRGRIHYATTLDEACKDADLVVENVPEKIEVKQAVFKQLDEVCPKHCYLNSNTSSLLMSDIYKDVSDERKAMTFSVDHDDPIRNSYLEMMWNPSTSEETKKAAIAHYHTLGFEPVITEREIKGYRLIRMCMPEFTHLPRFLAPRNGSAHGYDEVQNVLSCLDAENRYLTTPSSVDFYPMQGSIEDHASNLPLAVTKCRQMVDNLRYLVGMEALFASQAVDLRKSDGNGDYVHLGKGTQKAYDVLRAVVPEMKSNRSVYDDINKAYQLVLEEKFLADGE